MKEKIYKGYLDPSIPIDKVFEWDSSPGFLDIKEMVHRYEKNTPESQQIEILIRTVPKGTK